LVVDVSADGRGPSWSRPNPKALGAQLMTFWLGDYDVDLIFFHLTLTSSFSISCFFPLFSWVDISRHDSGTLTAGFDSWIDLHPGGQLITFLSNSSLLCVFVCFFPPTGDLKMPALITNVLYLVMGVPFSCLVIFMFVGFFYDDDVKRRTRKRTAHLYFVFYPKKSHSWIFYSRWISNIFMTSSSVFCLFDQSSFWLQVSNVIPATFLSSLPTPGSIRISTSP
jgi:hypothetical protein